MEEIGDRTGKSENRHISIHFLFNPPLIGIIAFIQNISIMEKMETRFLSFYLYKNILPLKY